MMIFSARLSFKCYLDRSPYEARFGSAFVGVRFHVELRTQYFNIHCCGVDHKWLFSIMYHIEISFAGQFNVANSFSEIFVVRQFAAGVQ